MIEKEKNERIWSFEKGRDRLEVKYQSDKPHVLSVQIYNEMPIGMFDCERVSTYFEISIENFDKLVTKIHKARNTIT